MQATTAVAITVLILIVGRNLWLYAQQRAHNRRQAVTDSGRDTANPLLFSDPDTPQHRSSSSTHDTGDSTGSAGGGSSESEGGNGGDD